MIFILMNIPLMIRIQIFSNLVLVTYCSISRAVQHYIIIFTFQSLFEELVLNGIIKEYPKVPLKDFRGDISYTGGTLKLKKKGQKAKEPTPGGGDVRRAIVEYCILPMSKDKTTQGYIQWHQTSCCLCCTCYTTFSAPPRTYLLRATPPLCPNWRH